VDVSNLVVYLVDDDASVRRALTRLLRSIGLETFAFASAAAFLRAGPWVPEACLILDVQMPDMTGWELLDHLQASGISLPVIIITAYNNVHMRDRTRQAGVVAYLQKPFDDQALLEALQRARSQRPQGSP
jgi:two-component system response regulator FixJ